MKEISIKERKLKIEISKILNLISQGKSFEIDIDGNIYVDEKISQKEIRVFKYETTENNNIVLNPNIVIKNIFNDYKTVIDGDSCILDLLAAWQKIIFLNQDRMLYFDHQTDGIELFEDEQLEQMGWNCIVCDISYREITDFIEANCKATLVYYDNQITFNGFVIIDDIEEVRIKVKDFLISTIKQKIEDGLIDIEDDEILESLEFFNIKV